MNVTTFCELDHDVNAHAFPRLLLVDLFFVFFRRSRVLLPACDFSCVLRVGARSRVGTAHTGSRPDGVIPLSVGVLAPLEENLSPEIASLGPVFKSERRRVLFLGSVLKVLVRVLLLQEQRLFVRLAEKTKLLYLYRTCQLDFSAFDRLFN